ncbi:MAG: excisionase family DNA binding protein [Paracoccaceae bacterium]|jgi:excisionase family DNA binding protein
MAPKIEDSFDSIKKLATRWDVSERTVRRLIEIGDLPAHRIGGQIRISSADREIYERRNRH